MKQCEAAEADSSITKTFKRTYTYFFVTLIINLRVFKSCRMINLNHKL